MICFAIDKRNSEQEGGSILLIENKQKVAGVKTLLIILEFLPRTGQHTQHHKCPHAEFVILNYEIKTFALAIARVL